MRLHHLHLRSPIPYVHSLRLQETLLSAHLAHKSLQRADPKDVTAPPNPTLLTFQTYPTYTVGRRHLTANPLSDEQMAFLTRGQIGRAASGHSNAPELATFFASPRGGLLTYHAPGQLTAYLVLDLRRHGLTPRCYIRMLENTVIRMCAQLGLPNTMTTDDPGVWVGESRSNTSNEKTKLQSTDRKICAIGVQISRGITTHGIGLNVWDASIDTLDANAVPERQRLFFLPEFSESPGSGQPSTSSTPAPGYLSWGFSRIVACGLEGKTVTWLDREIPNFGRRSSIMKTVADALTVETANSLSIDQDIVDITEADLT